MNKKGFTLPEVLGVVVLLAIIAVISISQITNRVNNSKGKITDAQKELILSAAKLFVDENRLEYKKEEGNVYCILVESIVKGGYLTSPILDVSGNEIDYNTKIKASYINDKFDFEYNPSGCNRKYENGTPIYFNPVTNLVCTEGEANKNINSNGTPTGIKAGCMKWYTFNDSSDNDTVNLILDHNTTPLVAWNSDKTSTEMKEVKEVLVNDTQTWNENVKKSARLISADEVAQITGNSNFNSKTATQNDYFYFDSNTSNKTVSGKGNSKYAWLFDYTKGCTTYGCNVADDNNYNLYKKLDGNNSPTEQKFQINAYWTSSSVANITDDAMKATGNMIWDVGCIGGLSNTYIHNVYNRGLRPVITLPKTILQ